jgi:CRISPR-associated protein Cmr5
MRNRNRSQRYAKAALTSIENIKDKEKLRDEYKSRADSFPVMVMQAGLAQSLGFLQARSEGKTDNGYGLYLHDLAAVLKAGDATSTNTGKDLQLSAINATLTEYRLLTRETLAAAGWLKRFAQAYIKKDQAENKK